MMILTCWFKAYNKRTGKYLALKFMKAKLGLFEDWDNCQDINYINEEKMLLEEVTKLNKFLAQPSFSEFIGIYEEENVNENEKNMIIVLEYGLGSMTEILKEKKERKESYSEEEICHIFSYLVTGLAEAQKLVIVHGDITPDNMILIEIREGKHQYKLSDFGCGFLKKNAKNGINGKESDNNEKIKSTENMQTKISAHWLKGFSEFYSAPEVIEIEEKKKIQRESLDGLFYDPWKADVFSLGVVILLMMGVSSKKIRTLKKNIESSFSMQIFRKKGYEHLFKIVSQMLKSDNGKRISFEELKKILGSELYPKKSPDEKISIMNLKDKFYKLPDDQKLKKYFQFIKLYFNLTRFETCFKYIELADKIIKNNFSSFLWSEYAELSEISGVL